MKEKESVPCLENRSMFNLKSFFYDERKFNMMLFASFFSFYFLLGCCLVWFQGGEYNAFGSDNYRSFCDLTMITGTSHYRIKVHPLFLLLCQPLCLFAEGIFQSPKISVLIVECFASASSLLIFKMLISELVENKKLVLLFCLIFGFSFSQIIFSTVPETFIFSGFFLTATWLFSVRLVKSQRKISFKDFVILIFFGVCCHGTTVTNIVFFSIPTFWIFLNTKNSFPKSVFKTIAVVFVVFLFTLLLAYIQKHIWFNAPIYTDSLLDAFFHKEKFEEYRYMSWKFSAEKLRYFIKQFFCYPLFASKIYLRFVPNKYSPCLFDSYPFSIKCVLSLAYLIGFFSVVKNLFCILKNKKFLDITLFAILCVVGNACLHFVYGAGECFIYSPHFLFLILLLIASGMDNFAKEKKSVVENVLLIFVALEFLNNVFRYFEFVNLERDWHVKLGTLYFSKIDALKYGSILLLAVIATTVVIFKTLKKFFAVKTKINFAFFISIYLAFTLIMGAGIRLSQKDKPSGIATEKHIASNGETIFDSENVKIYFFNDSIYYITSKSNDNSKRYFLHFYTEDKRAENLKNHGFVNKDFNFKDFELKVPAKHDTRIAAIKLPKDYLISALRTGQFETDKNNENYGKRYWQTFIQVDSIKTFDACFVKTE